MLPRLFPAAAARAARARAPPEGGARAQAAAPTDPPPPAPPAPQSAGECSDDSCADLELLSARPAKQHRISAALPLVNASNGLGGLSNLHILRGAEALSRSAAMGVTSVDYQSLQDDCLDQFHASNAGQAQRRIKAGITQLGSGVFSHGPAIAASNSDPAPGAHRRPAASLDAACPRPLSAGRMRVTPEAGAAFDLSTAAPSLSQQSSQASCWGSPLPPRHQPSAFHSTAQAAPLAEQPQPQAPLSRQHSACSDVTTAALPPAPARRPLTMDPAPAVTNSAALPRSCSVTHSYSSMDLGSDVLASLEVYLDEQQQGEQQQGEQQQGEQQQGEQQQGEQRRLSLALPESKGPQAGQLQPGKTLLRGCQPQPQPPPPAPPPAAPAPATAGASASAAAAPPAELLCREGAVRAPSEAPAEAGASAASSGQQALEVDRQPGQQGESQAEVEPPFVGWFSRCRCAAASAAAASATLPCLPTVALYAG
jgi:hypothetical protein